jgi:hypothetical protein
MCIFPTSTLFNTIFPSNLHHPPKPNTSKPNFPYLPNLFPSLNKKSAKKIPKTISKKAFPKHSIQSSTNPDPYLKSKNQAFAYLFRKKN